MKTVEDSWTSIHNWLNENVPELLESLGDSANTQAISDAEKALQVDLPADFKASLGIHDGQSNESMGFVEASEFLSLSRMVDEWNVWKSLLDGGEFADTSSEPVGPIKSDWWNPRWIPFTYDGAGNHLCIDLDPAEGGTKGQVITMWHDDPDRRVIAPSFQAWLNKVADGLKNGDYVYSDDYGGIVSKDDV